MADLLDGTQPLQRDRSRHRLEIILAEAPQPFRQDVAGQDRIYGVPYFASSIQAVRMNPSCPALVAP